MFKKNISIVLFFSVVSSICLDSPEAKDLARTHQEAFSTDGSDTETSNQIERRSFLQRRPSFYDESIPTLRRVLPLSGTVFDSIVRTRTASTHTKAKDHQIDLENSPER